MAKVIVYKRSGNFGHKGRPGQVGGSASSLPGTILPNKPLSEIAQLFVYNRRAITGILQNLRSGLMDTSGQSSTPKPGVSREEMKRYFDMTDLFKQATSEKYAYQKPGETVADYLDNLMYSNGFSERTKLPRGAYRLHKPGKPAEGFDVRDPAGKAYMKLLDMLDEMGKD